MQHRPTRIGRFESRSLMLIASWAIGAAGVACTPNTRPPPPSTTTDQDVGAAFRAADSNRDGQLNREETRVMPTVRARFDAIDTNQDQHISLDELAKAIHP